MHPTVKYKIVFEASAMCNDDSAFTDMNVHRLLRKKGIANPEGEWFRCTVKDIQAALLEIQSGVKNEENRTLHFAMRPELIESGGQDDCLFQAF
ncbi:MAG: hypothetical protein LH618_13065 [Saprospiraceae bacterium]|nr:hypothetical protein [Saprospiraceae bacterium]